MTKKYIIEVDESEIIEYWNEQGVKEIGYQEYVLKSCPNIKVKPWEERPQGKWIEGSNGNIKCNKCGAEIRYSYLANNKPDFPKFCCDCGADMRGKEE